MEHCTVNDAKDIVIIGHVTKDIFHSGARLGGAVTYAAQAAQSLGYRVFLVTACRADEPLLEYLNLGGCDYPPIDLFICKSEKTTVFSIDYSGPERQVSLIARAETIRAEAIPDHIFSKPFVYLAPVVDEIDLNIINRFRDACIVIGVQGWLRDMGPNGKIIPREYEKKFEQKVKAIVYSELDHPQSEALAHRFLDTADIVVITRSARGVTVLNNGRSVDLPAISAVEVDPTGAGDVFGIVLGLGVSAGLDPIDAANRAIEAASRVVEGPGIGRLMDIASRLLPSC